MTRILRQFLLPPGIFIELALLVLLLWHWRRPRLARAVLAGLTLLLYALSLSPVARALMNGLNPYPPLSAEQLRRFAPEVIVVLGSGGHPQQPEVGGAGVGRDSLERTFYAVHLHRQTGLPLLFSGSGWQDFAVADAMARAAQTMGVPAERIWTETESHDTLANALCSERVLSRRGLTRVVLVTQYWHMRRAMYAFAQTRLQALPAPYNANLPTPLDQGLLCWLPDHESLDQSSRALEEWLGLLYYRLRT